MDGLDPRNALLEGGKSEALRAAFATVAEATVADEPKFDRRTVHELARLVTCRAFSGPLLELCHLAAAADRLGGYPDLFWNSGPARPSAFRARCARPPLAAPDGPRLTRGASGLGLAYADGAFMVTYARMPLLSALLEFLVTALGFAAVDEALSPPPTRAAQVSDRAKGLARALHAYLADHLPTAQAQRRFRALAAFLRQRSGPAFSVDDLDDAAVLAFWLVTAPDPALDLRTYGSALDACGRFIQALLAAADRAALTDTLSLRDGDEAAADLAAVDPAPSPLARLAAPPADRVKALTRREAAGLEPLDGDPETVRRLPLSLMRRAVIGPAQNAMIQARRRGEAHPAADFPLDYAAYRAGLEAQSAHLERVILAGLHVLDRHRRAEATVELLDRLPRAAAASLAGEPAPGTSPGTWKRASDLLGRLRDGLRRDERATALLDQARRAHGRLSRQGFRDEDRADPAVVDGFAAALPALGDLRRRVDRHRDRLDRHMPDGNTLWAADRPVIEAHLITLHGDHP